MAESDYLNRFNKAMTNLLSIDIKVEENYKTLLLIGSLNKSYKRLGKALLYRKDSIAYEDAVALLSDEFISKDSNESRREASNSLYADTSDAYMRVGQDRRHRVKANCCAFIARRKTTLRKIAKRRMKTLKSCMATTMVKLDWLKMAITTAISFMSPMGLVLSLILG